MKIRRLLVVSILLSIFLAMNSYSQSIPAFPGAEGFGKFTTGGRNGKIIYVNNLNDDNYPGSLRYAINQTGPRTVIFSVSGTIRLTSALSIKNGSITIAGQTAPGDGICLRDYPVVVDADNVIIRFMRFRMGDETNQENDALWGREQKNIILDHCSMSWSTDECSSFYDNENFTMQWCILSESLRNSVHGKGTHGYGGIWGGKNASFHHNLLSVHDSRNPRFCGSRYSNTPTLEMVDFRNNAIFNWGSNNSYGAEGGNYNIINNYYKPGPATGSSKSRILQPYADDGSNSQPAGIHGKFYITGNHLIGSSTVTNDNWAGVVLHASFASYAPGITKSDIRAEVEFPVSGMPTHTALKAFEKILAYGGASLKRDTIDRRIINDATTGTATVKSGGNGSTNGLIDTQSAVGGWPSLASLPAPADSDADGMPDAWEDANGLNKSNAADAQITTIDDFYPNVEVYLASLVELITLNQVKDAITTSTSFLPKGEYKPALYLNLSASKLIIRHITALRRVDIYSSTGSLLKSINCRSNKEEIDIGEFRPAVYIVRITDEKEVFSATKIIIGIKR